MIKTAQKKNLFLIKRKISAEYESKNRQQHKITNYFKNKNKAKLKQTKYNEYNKNQSQLN